jgi:putative ABC transport system permease protein
MMSSMNHNFERLFLSERAMGGWDITVDENPSNPLNDLRGTLTSAGSPAVSNIEAIGLTSTVTRFRARICDPVAAGVNCNITSSPDDFEEYQVHGQDPSFFSTAQVPLQARARGYANDQAVWQTVARDPAFAVVDSNALTGDFAPPIVESIDAGTQNFDPARVVLADARTGRSQEVTIIGVIEMGASATYAGVHVSDQTLTSIYGEPDTRRYFVKTIDGADNKETARQIEASLLTTGAQAESLKDHIEEENATFSGFFFLMQGFMGLGLFVGVAAVGVIAFRTVVERRQQIGMLRALGYTRGMVGLTFLIESAFIAFMGVLSGIVFAVILARQLITDEFENQGGASFTVPWEQLLLIGGLAFGFALPMTLIPSRQAASIPIAEALRYE